MTAVEWFAKQVLEYKSPTNVNGTDYILIPVDKIDFLKEQSKEMEKEQKEKTYTEAFNAGYDNASEYYNETFKSE